MQEEKATPTAEQPNNRRNGYSPKNIKGTFGEATIAVPRDRNGEYEQILIALSKSKITIATSKIKQRSPLQNQIF
ncbi:hypothetical protein APA_2519 [Pseudanabaena sp. lw0831]|uniref:transposase n=1 Tax=Pseudanabaena sp. lw0831 TaxID=1357935 RepID=UPI001A1F0F7C|nr:hypothetical protein APA_2519 [Pseudanabaena sp. lw0831]